MAIAGGRIVEKDRQLFRDAWRAGDASHERACHLDALHYICIENTDEIINEGRLNNRPMPRRCGGLRGAGPAERAAPAPALAELAHQRGLRGRGGKREQRGAGDGRRGQLCLLDPGPAAAALGVHARRRLRAERVAASDV